MKKSTIVNPTLQSNIHAAHIPAAQTKVNLTAPPAPAALWRLPEVLRNVPVSRATLYSWIEQGRFPKPIKIGARAVAWRSEQVLAFAAQ